MTPLQKSEHLANKYQIGERVLLKNNRIEKIMSIIISPRWSTNDIDVKYHFERMWCAFRWEDQIVCSVEDYLISKGL